mmetsp:Transcript_72554/g.187167  ORF Transcript_72554/g.187167 Transcript_72554/m.187167 type:complete len:222 (-) Transcript_72554:265-930(-)
MLSPSGLPASHVTGTCSRMPYSEVLGSVIVSQACITCQCAPSQTSKRTWWLSQHETVLCRRLTHCTLSVAASSATPIHATPIAQPPSQRADHAVLLLWSKALTLAPSSGSSDELTGTAPGRALRLPVTQSGLVWKDTSKMRQVPGRSSMLTSRQNLLSPCDDAAGRQLLASACSSPRKHRSHTEPCQSASSCEQRALQTWRWVRFCDAATGLSASSAPRRA